MTWECWVLICHLILPPDGSEPYVDHSKDCTTLGPLTVTATDYAGAMRSTADTMQALDEMWTLYALPPSRFNGNCRQDDGATTRPPRSALSSFR